MSVDIQQRKNDHLDLCATNQVAFRDCTTLLEQVRLVHQSLPELALEEIDLSVRLLGKKLKAPIVIAGMTGGTERAREVNRTLAKLADQRGYAFGLGSQRAMQRKPETADTYRVRDVAPNVLLLGNIGVVQAREWSTEIVAQLIQAVGADAVCLHMNPAMELIQPGGDRNFKGCLDTFERLVRELPVPVVAKETGSGVSAETARRLFECGVRTVDVSGAGGTSWVAVETLRAEGQARSIGQDLWDWGIPTAASIHLTTGAGMQAIATGGIRNGLDVARSLVLGATAAGIARNVFMAYEQGGESGASAFLDEVEHELRAVMLLCGARTVDALRRVPRIIGGDLQRWIDLGGHSS